MIAPRFSMLRSTWTPIHCKNTLNNICLYRSRQLTCARLRSIVSDTTSKRDKSKRDMSELSAKLRENIYTIPNLLSVTRLAICPAIGYLVYTQSHYPTALALFGVASLSDAVDGYIARRWKSQSSLLGAVLDPVADKALMTTLTVSLAHGSLLPMPLAALIISRDVGLVLGGLVVRYRSIEAPVTVCKYFDITMPTVQVSPTQISKGNTALQMLLLGMTLASPVMMVQEVPELAMALTGMQWLVGTTTILSGLSYLTSNDAIKYLRKAK